MMVVWQRMYIAWGRSIWRRGTRARIALVAAAIALLALAWVIGSMSGSAAAKDDRTIEISVVGKIDKAGECAVPLRAGGFIALPLPHQVTIENADGTIVGMRNLQNLGKPERGGEEESICFAYVSLTVADSPFYTVRVDGDFLATVDRSDLPFERSDDVFTLMPTIQFEH